MHLLRHRSGLAGGPIQNAPAGQSRPAVRRFPGINPGVPIWRLHPSTAELRRTMGDPARGVELAQRWQRWPGGAGRWMGTLDQPQPPRSPGLPIPSQRRDAWSTEKSTEEVPSLRNRCAAAHNSQIELFGAPPQGCCAVPAHSAQPGTTRPLGWWMDQGIYDAAAQHFQSKGRGGLTNAILQAGCTHRRLRLPEAP